MSSYDLARVPRPSCFAGRWLIPTPPRLCRRCLCSSPIGHADRGSSLSEGNVIDCNPVDVLSDMRIGGLALRCAVEVENIRVILLCESLTTCNEDKLLETIGETRFNELLPPPTSPG
jgi:hypothetical protein